MNREKEVVRILMDLGVPCHLRGYDLIRQAVLMMLEDKSYCFGITKALYPDIAKKNNMTAQNIERNIRHAIECTFKDILPEIREKYFGNSVLAEKGKPCNSQFLATIAERINHKEAYDG